MVSLIRMESWSFSAITFSFFLAVPCRVWDPCSLTRDLTRAPCSGSTESWPLGHWTTGPVPWSFSNFNGDINLEKVHVFVCVNVCLELLHAASPLQTQDMIIKDILCLTFRIECLMVWGLKSGCHGGHSSKSWRPHHTLWPLEAGSELH